MDEIEWFAELQKLGFSNEQIVDMWKAKQVDKTSGSSKKRKLECLFEKEEEENSFLNDQVIGIVLSFLNENWWAFRMILVNRQFKRAVSNIKTLYLNKRAVPKIPCLIDSGLCEQIERLIVFTELDHSLLQQLVYKCVNIKYLTVSIRKPPLSISFTKPTIQEIKIIDTRDTKLHVHFSIENLEEIAPQQLNCESIEPMSDQHPKIDESFI